MRPFRRSTIACLVLAGLVVGGGAFLFGGRFVAGFSSARGDYERGKHLAALKMTSDARNAYLAAVRRDPRFAPPYRALAQMAAADGAYNDARQLWTDYLQRAPGAAHAWCGLAYSELMIGREIPALRAAEREIRANPACARAHLIAGVLYARKSDAKRALEHLGPAAASPQYAHYPRVHLIYGRVLALSGDYDRAEEVLQRVTQQKVANAEPFFWLGWIAARRGAAPDTTEAARKYFARALNLQPDYPEAHLEMGRLLLRERRAPDALTHIERAAATRNHYPAALYALSQAYAAVGRSEDAERTRRAFRRESDLAAREKALLRQYAADPDQVAIATLIDLGQTLLARDKPEAALLFLRDALRRAPEDRRVQSLIAKMQSRGATLPAVAAAPRSAPVSPELAADEAAAVP